MEFTQEKALEIIRAFGLKPHTNEVWKHRKQIPERYNKTLIPMRQAWDDLPIEFKARVINGIADKPAFSKYIDTAYVPWDITEKYLKVLLSNIAAYNRRVIANNAPDNFRRIYEMAKKESGKDDLYFFKFFNTKNINEVIQKITELSTWEISAYELFTECNQCGHYNPNDDAPDPKHCENCNADLYPGIE